MKISIEKELEAPINEVWKAWGSPEDITQLNFATDDWCCPAAEINL